MADFTGMAWEGMPYPPIPNEERYTQLAEAFFAIPATPDSRLQRDIWNRMNALNQKKLDELHKKAKEQAKLQAKLEQRQRQAEEIEQQSRDGDSNELAEIITGLQKGRRRKLCKQWLLVQKKSWGRWYHLTLTPLIAKMIRAATYFVWLWSLATFKQYPKHGFQLKPNIILP